MKYFPYSRQCIDDDDIQEVVGILRSDFITQGPEIKRFEESVSHYLGVKYAVAVSSGTAALHIACLAGEITKDHEVITSPITFAASSNCVLYCGGTPVFADIEREIPIIDVKDIENKINTMTKAIIPVHMAGHPCNMEKIYEIAKNKNLIIIEDAAHALGSEYQASNGNWIKVGKCQHSDMTILSFHPVKHITTGEGGIVLTNSEEFHKRLVVLRNHGITKEYLLNESEGDWYYEMQDLGFNYRITDIQAALGRSQLKKSDLFVKRRREIAQRYNSAFSDNPYFQIPMEKENCQSSYHLYIIRLRNLYAGKREAVFRLLRSQGLGVQVHYIPVYFHPYYQKRGFQRGLCPKAEDYFGRCISLPLFPAMSDGDIEIVVEKVFEVFESIKVDEEEKLS